MPLLEVRHLSKEFSRKKGLFGKGTVVRAVDDVSFSIEKGETFGLVGESGSGKTTTGTLHPAAHRADGRRSALRRPRRAEAVARRSAPGAARHADRLPGSVLLAEPAHARADIVEEPLIIHKLGSKAERRGARRGAVRAGRAQPRSPAALSARVQRRAAAAHRPRAGAGAESVAHHRRRAGLGARRLGAGAGGEPADGAAGAAEADLPLHRARSAAGASTSAAASRSCIWGGSWRWERRRSCSPRRSIRTRGRCCRRSRCPIPTRPRQRIVLDTRSFDPPRRFGKSLPATSPPSSLIRGPPSAPNTLSRAPLRRRAPLACHARSFADAHPWCRGSRCHSSSASVPSSPSLPPPPPSPGTERADEARLAPKNPAAVTDMSGEFRFAARTLARWRGGLAVAILTLALGVGTVTALYSLAQVLARGPRRGAGARSRGADLRLERRAGRRARPVALQRVRRDAVARRVFPVDRGVCGSRSHDRFRGNRAAGHRRLRVAGVFRRHGRAARGRTRIHRD